MNKAKTKIYKSGNGQAINIKKSILKESGLKIGDEITYFADDNGRIVLKKSDQSFKNRWRRFVDNGGTYDEEEIDWGESIGRELT